MRGIVENAYDGQGPVLFGNGVSSAVTYAKGTCRSTMCGVIESYNVKYITLPNYISKDKLQLSSTSGTITGCYTGEEFEFTGVSPGIVQRALYNLITVGSKDESAARYGRIGLAELPKMTYAANGSVDYRLLDSEARYALYAKSGNTMFSFPAFRYGTYIYFTIPVYLPPLSGQHREFAITFQDASKASLRFIAPSGKTGSKIDYNLNVPARYTFWQDMLGISARYEVPELLPNAAGNQAGLVSAMGSNASYSITLSWTVVDDDEEEEEEP